ncbi:hypothetical protein ACHWQZ_G008474 [Mnemiopsis leidyi]
MVERSRYKMLAVLVLLIFGIQQSLAGSLPIWPDDFRFSASGTISGYDCVHIYEPDDLGDGWGNNYYCWKNDRVSPGLYWTWTSNTSGRKCTKVEEGGSGWGNTYICVPQGSHYNFVWGRSGQVSGYTCSRWNEPDDGKWSDNYLCGTVSTKKCTSVKQGNKLSEKCTSLSSSSKLSTTERFPVYAGSTITVQCKTSGYTTLSVTSNLLTCNTGSTYNPPATCLLDTCEGWPDAVSHLTADTSVFPIDYGTQLTVQCDTGYSVTAGDTEITCVKGTTFLWNDQPECTLDQCSGLPPGSTYLTVISFPVDVGTAITVTCPPALLHSGSSVITCVKGTNFETTDQPQCTQVGKFKEGG